MNNPSYGDKNRTSELGSLLSGPRSEQEKMGSYGHRPLWWNHPGLTPINWCINDGGVRCDAVPRGHGKFAVPTLRRPTQQGDHVLHHSQESVRRHIRRPDVGERRDPLVARALRHLSPQRVSLLIVQLVFFLLGIIERALFSYFLFTKK